MAANVLWNYVTYIVILNIEHCSLNFREFFSEVFPNDDFLICF